MPEKDRIIRIVASIVRVMLNSEDGALSPDVVFDALVREGHSPSDIMRSLSVLAQIFEQFSVEEFHFEGTKRLRYRDLAPEESMRLTDEARRIFDDWKRWNLPSPEETEKILDHVVSAGFGEIDTSDLVLIARNVATPGTPFALLLAEDKGRQ